MREHHSGNKRLRRTVESVAETASSPRSTRNFSGAQVNVTALPPVPQPTGVPEPSSSSSSPPGARHATSSSHLEQASSVWTSYQPPRQQDMFCDPTPLISQVPQDTAAFPLPPLPTEVLSHLIPPWGDDIHFPHGPDELLLVDLQNLLTENFLTETLDS